MHIPRALPKFCLLPVNHPQRPLVLHQRLFRLSNDELHERKLLQKMPMHLFITSDKREFKRLHERIAGQPCVGLPQRSGPVARASARVGGRFLGCGIREIRMIRIAVCRREDLMPRRRKLLKIAPAAPVGFPPIEAAPLRAGAVGGTARGTVEIRPKLSQLCDNSDSLFVVVRITLHS